MKFRRHFSFAFATAMLLIWSASYSVHAQDDPAALAPPPGTSPSDLGLAELTDDPKPDELFREVIDAAKQEDPNLEKEIQQFSLYGPFLFPNDALIDVTTNQPRKDAIFGADISHYTNLAYPIEDLASRHVDYLYIKASQGRGVDGSFSRFWARAGRLPKGDQVFRGAFHFLTCGDRGISAEEWGKAQADAFVKIIVASGGLRATDLPPALDLEWDRTNSERDRWVCRSAPQIIATAKAFLSEVEAKLHRKPILYTARAWWHERIGPETSFSAFAQYPLWLADYSKSSRASETPKLINKSPLTLWQFTDGAKLAIGFNAGFDANVFKGSKADFLKMLNTADFE